MTRYDPTLPENQRMIADAAARADRELPLVSEIPPRVREVSPAPMGPARGENWKGGRAAVRCEVGGKVYESFADASRATGHSAQTLHYAARHSGKLKNGTTVTIAAGLAALEGHG